MFKKFLITLIASLSLVTVGVCAQPQQIAEAQSVHQKVPTSYRGTWHHGKIKLVLHARSIKAPIIHLKGHQMGVKRYRHSVSVFQQRHGKAIAEPFNMQRKHHKGHVALKVFYISRYLYFTK
ncbi:hypothetical protein DA798_09160 [Lactobacillus sp. PFC-70]|nr:hypothetical protein DA798_09160 [Lactobacillus sp. PFC-70]